MKQVIKAFVISLFFFPLCTFAMIQATGTAVFINNDGYLITDQHVTAMGPPEQMYVYYKTIKYKATIIDSDSKQDIAIIHVPLKNTPYAVIQPKETPGESITTFGFPLSFQFNFSQLRYPAKVLGALTDSDHNNWLMFNGPVCKGQSGGALMENSTGYLLGLVDFAFGDMCANFGGAGKASDLIKLLDKNHIKYTKPTLVMTLYHYLLPTNVLINRMTDVNLLVTNETLEVK